MPGKSITCDQCGASFHKKPSHVTDLNFCSRSCYWTHRRNRPFVTVPCTHCGKIIRPSAPGYHGLERRFCSRRCSMLARPQLAPMERLLSHREIDEATGCWNWTGTLDRGGYGKVRVNGSPSIRVHRLSAHLFSGFDLNSDLLICHYCDNPRCFNPEHLFPGTPRDNNDDRAQKGRTARQLGSVHGQAKLDETTVSKIRQLCKSGVEQKQLAEHYGVSRATICNIVKRKTWRHIP